MPPLHGGAVAIRGLFSPICSPAEPRFCVARLSEASGVARSEGMGNAFPSPFAWPHPNRLAVDTETRAEKRIMLWTIAVVLFVLWILGFGVFHVASGLIHLLLVVAVIAVIYNLIAGRRTTV
jgi:hypothetical protein